jgi:hypothetical protein
MNTPPNIPVTNTILDFIKELKKYNTAIDAIKNIFNEDNDAIQIYKTANKTLNLKSKQGFIYELLWDICIKLNITELTDVYEPHNNIHHLVGNVNNNTSTFETINDFFNNYLKQKYISGNSGGYSDITFTLKNKDLDTILYLSSAKYFVNTKLITQYDIQNLCTIIKEREKDNYNEIKTLLFVNDKKDFIKKCKDANQSSNVLIRYISPNGNYENVYDLNDLEKHYTKLRKILKDFNFLKTTIDIDNFNEKYLKKIKKKFIPRFHQDLFIEKIKELIHKNEKKILVGAIPRSGKTFIMAGTILSDVIIENEKKHDKKYNNYVIITPAPNETLDQYFKAFDDYYDFMNNDIVPIKIKETPSKDEFKGQQNKHNVFLISKQRLGFKDKKDNINKDNDDNANNINYNDKTILKIKENIKKYFGEKKFNIIFFDEAHFGMTTTIAQDIFKELDKEDKAFKIYVTATYSKPKQIYDIDDKNIIKWDLNDIKMIKNIKSEKTFLEAVKNLENKFGTRILNKVLKNTTNIVDQYTNFPEPYLITSVWDTDFINDELEKLKTNTTFGFDMGKLFMTLKDNDSFENKQQLIQFLEYYFGYFTGDNKTNYYEKKNEYKKRGIIPIIEEVCTNYCRTLQPQHKTTQLWFLPPYNISKIVRALLLLLKDKFNYIFESYMFYIAVDYKIAKTADNIQYMSEPKNIKSEIEELEKKLYTNDKYKKYNGLIILAGNRLQLGISLKNVDIVSLFTNITASDAIYQMLFRSMTEIDDDIECDGINYCGRKRYGFMVDLNPQRTLYTIEYLTDMYLAYNKKSKDSKYELIADLINIDKHKFIDKYNREDKKGYQKYVEEFFHKLYNAWDVKTNKIMEILLKNNIFTNDIFKPDFNITKLFTSIEKQTGVNKIAIHKPENEIDKGKNMSINAVITKPEKGKKIPTSEELWAYLFSEVISILSLITSYTKEDGSECVFNDNNTSDFIYNLQYIIKIIKDDEKEMFLYTLRQRIIMKDIITDDELFNMVYNSIFKLKDDNQQLGGTLSDINKQIHLRKNKLYNITELDKLLEFINDNLKPKIIETKKRGEVFTPMFLVNEMLDTLNKLPEDVWHNPNLKWLDPAAGMGNYPVAIYMRLMKGLENVIKDEEARRKHILTEMLYMVELDKKNVFMMKKIFCGKTYKLNIFQGSFIDIDIDFKHFKKVNIELKFDIILGNPPFQYKKPENVKAQQIWHYFIKRSYEELLEDKGYLLFIHPSGWRDIDGDYENIFKYITEHNLIYLSMNDYKEGKRVFDVTTNFDYYLVQNTKTDTNITKISDIDNNPIYEINLNKWDFIPSGYFNIFKKLLAVKKPKVNILHDWSMYETRKPYISKEKDEVFKYPIVNTISIDKNINLVYSNIKKGHFGISKVIWTNGTSYPIIDKKGKYGLTQFAYAIIDDNDKLEKIQQAMLNENFINLMKYIMFKELHKYNYKIIALFKKDFYKYFLPT